MNFHTIHRAVLLTDIVNSAGLAEHAGDMGFARLMAEFELLIRYLIRQYNGREIDKTDGFLIVFENPSDAVAAALALSRAMHGFTKTKSVPFVLRTGLHFGALVERRNLAEDIALGAKAIEVDGITKIVAARITSMAEPGQILITRPLFNLTRQTTSAFAREYGNVLWMAHGEYLLQGIQDPVDIYEVGDPDFAPLIPPGLTKKSRRAVLPQDEITLGWRPAAGQLIPTAIKWTLEQKLGEGGYGEVWLAKRPGGDRRVFKFCFNAGRLRSLKRERFLLSAIQEKLGQRNDIVKILNWNVSTPPFYLTFQYEPADNLFAWFEKQTTPVTEVVALIIIEKIAEALSASHSIGILHKDIKPSNILIIGNAANPGIRLIDFGIGLYTPTESTGFGTERSDGTDPTTVKTSLLSGTRTYVAPELLEGNRPSLKSDVYSIGVLLYQMLNNDLKTGLKVGWERSINDVHLRQLISDTTDGNLRSRLGNMSEFILRLRSLNFAREASRQEEIRQAREIQMRMQVARPGKSRWYYSMACVAAISMLILCFRCEVSARRSNRTAMEQSLRAESAVVASKQNAETALASQKKLDSIITLMAREIAPTLIKSDQMDILEKISSTTLSLYEEDATASQSEQGILNVTSSLLLQCQVDLKKHRLKKAGEHLSRGIELAGSQGFPEQEQIRIYGTAANYLAELAKESDTDDFSNIATFNAMELTLRRKIHSKSNRTTRTAIPLANSLIKNSLVASKADRHQLLQEAYNLTNGMFEPEDPSILMAYSDSCLYLGCDSDLEQSKRLLGLAIKLHRSLADDDPDNEKLKSGLALRHARLASVEFGADDLQNAANNNAAAIKQFGELERNEPLEPDEKLELANALRLSSKIACGAGNLSECIRLLDQATSAYDSLMTVPGNFCAREEMVSIKEQMVTYLALAQRLPERNAMMQSQLKTLRTILKTSHSPSLYMTRYLMDVLNFSLTSGDVRMLEVMLDDFPSRVSNIDFPNASTAVTIVDAQIIQNRSAQLPTWKHSDKYGNLGIIWTDLKNDSPAPAFISIYRRGIPEPFARFYLPGGKTINVGPFPVPSGISIENSEILSLGELVEKHGHITMLTDLIAGEMHALDAGARDPRNFAH